MRTCPICHATCFDDMEVCFGCMHRFEAAADAVDGTPPEPCDSSQAAFGRFGCETVDGAVRHGAFTHEGKTAPFDMRAESMLQERVPPVVDAAHASGKSTGQSVQVPLGGIPYQIVINLQPIG